MIMKGITDIHARLDQNQSSAEARFNEIESKLQTMEKEHEYLSSFVTLISNNLNELQVKVRGFMLSHTVNHSKSVDAISLRSGKVLEPKIVQPSDEEEEPVDEEIICESPPVMKSKVEKSKAREESQPSEEVADKDSSKEASANDRGTTSNSGALKQKGKEVTVSDLPFPNSFCRDARPVKKHVIDSELYDLFSKIEVNIPMLDLIQKVPQYAKFLKELCTKKRQIKTPDSVVVGSVISAMYTAFLPSKMSDPGSYSVSCIIGKSVIPNALLDSGAAINMMPKSIYDAIGLNCCKPTSTSLHMADNTIRIPYGIVEDVLVKVKDLVFPTDFIVLEMSKDNPSSQHLILGRPFLVTAKAKLDMGKGIVYMAVGDHKVCFDFNKDEKQEQSKDSLFGVKMICADNDTSVVEYVSPTLSSPPSFDIHSDSVMHKGEVSYSSGTSVDCTLSGPCNVSKSVSPNSSLSLSSNASDGGSFSDGADIDEEKTAIKGKKPSRWKKKKSRCNMKKPSTLVPTVPPPSDSTEQIQGELKVKTKKHKPLVIEKVSRIELKVPTANDYLPSSLSPIYIDYEDQAALQVIETFERDPFPSDFVRPDDIKKGDLVWGLVSSVIFPDSREKFRWIGPMKVEEMIPENKSALVHYNDNSCVCFKLDRIRLYLSSYKPP